MKRKKYLSIFLGMTLAVMAISMLLLPQQSVAAAMNGLHLWWEVIVPSLLPFFIISNLLISIGAAQAAGHCFAPFMRPLFNLPGAASLAIVLGFCSGFPTGAAVTADLRRQGLISREEAARLLAFTNNAGPLYITVAVAAGLFGQPAAAMLLASGHYGLDLLLGIILGLFSRSSKTSAATALPSTATPPGSLGNLMKEAARAATNNILIIGCYMAFFSVLAELICLILPSSITPMLRAMLSGVWEMSLGIDTLSTSGLPLALALPLAAAILAFGGFSVQMQVLAMVSDTDISPRLYLICRPLHAAAACIYTALLLPHIVQQTSTLPIEAVHSISPLTYSLITAMTIVLLWLGMARITSRRKASYNRRAKKNNAKTGF